MEYYWTIIYCNCRDFFILLILLKQVNHTILKLILKSHHAETIEDCSPIWYYNVYKVISKVITSRLFMVLNSIVDWALVAFVGERNIAKNIHLV